MKKVRDEIIDALDPKNPQYEANAEQLRAIMKTKDYKAFAEVIGGLIAGGLELEDIVPSILGELQWNDVTGKDQRFQAPTKIIGNTATTIENGMTHSTAKIVANKVYTPPEYIGTPSYPVDTEDLKAGDLATAQSIRDYAMQALIVKKCLTMHTLLCSGTRMTDTTVANSRVIAIEDDGSWSAATDTPAYVREVKKVIEDEISKLQDVSGGRPTIKGYCRQITLDKIQRADLPSVDWYAIPAANDELERPYFTEGDIVLVAPGAASVALVMDVEPSELVTSHFEIAYAFRWGHKWILWDDKFLRRIVITKTEALEAATVELDSFSTTEMDLYFSKPVAKNTITETSVVVSTSTAGNVPEGLTYTVTMGADLRHVNIAFSEALTAGTTYYVRVDDNEVEDIYDDSSHYFSAMTYVTVVP